MKKLFLPKKNLSDMKKLILILCVCIILFAGAVYFLIPTSQKLAYQTVVSCTESGVSRQIINKEKWPLWWPGQIKNNSVYSYKSYEYNFKKILLNGIETTIGNKQDSVKGFLQFAYNGNDSTQFLYTSNYNFSANPFKKIVQYFQLKKIENNIENLLADIKKYFDNPENIYGLNILKQKVTESSMISLKHTFQHYPSTQEIYGMIQSVKEYIHTKGGEENDFPMFHVQVEEPTTYEVMVAIPTKIDLPSEDKFQLKKMVLGKILVAEVKGGIYSVMKGDEELTNYISDYKKISPAIPFQSLVTNRLLEADTTKWITKLYYPVFQ